MTKKIWIGLSFHGKMCKRGGYTPTDRIRTKQSAGCLQTVCLIRSYGSADSPWTACGLFDSQQNTCPYLSLQIKWSESSPQAVCGLSYPGPVGRCVSTLTPWMHQSTQTLKHALFSFSCISVLLIFSFFIQVRGEKNTRWRMKKYYYITEFS